MPFLSAAYAFLCAHWPAILAFLAIALPTLITGLTPYPQASGFVSFLRLLLNILSVATHSDSPGTFKAPLTISKQPDPSADVIPINRGYARIATLAFLIVMCSAIGCASIFGATAKRDVIDCGKEALKAAAADAAPQVSIALTGGSANWRGQLGDLEQHAGDAVLCAVAALVRGFEQAHAHESAPLLTVQSSIACAGDNCAPSSVEVHLLGIDRGRDYLVGRAAPVEPIVP